MPSQFDNSQNRLFSQPTYDTEEDRVRQQRVREADEILEEMIPRLPSREEELEYMEW